MKKRIVIILLVSYILLCMAGCRGRIDVKPSTEAQTEMMESTESSKVDELDESVNQNTQEAEQETASAEVPAEETASTVAPTEETISVTEEPTEGVTPETTPAETTPVETHPSTSNNESNMEGSGGGFQPG